MKREMQRDLDEMLREEFQKSAGEEEGSREFGLLLAQKDFQDLDNELVAIAEERTWGLFDTFSGLLVIANSAVIGYEVTLSEKDQQDQVYYLYVVEIIFLCLFTVELAILRDISPILYQHKCMYHCLWDAIDLLVACVHPGQRGVQTLMINDENDVLAVRWGFALCVCFAD